MADVLNSGILNLQMILWSMILFSSPAYSSGFRIACYFSNVAQYRSGIANFQSTDFDPFLCTHIIFSYAKVSGLHISPSEWNDASTYDNLIALKRDNSKLKVLLAVGHVMGTPEVFYEAVKTDISRRKFAENVVKYVRDKNLDGISLEWFNIALKTTAFFKKEQFQKLLKRIKREFANDANFTSQPELILAVSTAAKKQLIDDGYIISELIHLVDFISIKTLDMRTAADRKVGPSASLYSVPGEAFNETQFNVAWIASYYESLGVPREKINIGIPTYGRTFTLNVASENNVGADAVNHGQSGKWSAINGMISYFELCELIQEGGKIVSIPYNRYYVKSSQWISYEDIISIVQKACFVVEKKYGGISVWTLDMDDFSGQRCRQGRYPLISKAALVIRTANLSLCTVESSDDYQAVMTYSTKFPIKSHFENDLDSKRLVCYMTNWSRYRRGSAKFLPEDINPNLCTHIIYAYAVISNKKIIPKFPDEDSVPWQEGLYHRVLRVKSYNPTIKVLLSIGGDGAGTAEFEAVSTNEETRRNFSRKVVSFLRERGFDGLEVCWAYPTAETSMQFQNFLQALRYAFDDDAITSDKHKLILTAAMTANVDTILSGYGENLFSTVLPLDFISLMTFDFHGKWNTHTGVNSPLFADESDKGARVSYSVDMVAQMYAKKGVPKYMINIGIPTYGVTFHLKFPWLNELGSPVSGPGLPGNYTGTMGMMAYYEVCKFIYSGAIVKDVASQVVRYAFMGDQWVGYEDIDSVTDKACYSIHSGFGGVSIWTLDLDDFNNLCGSGNFPLLKAVNEAIKKWSTACYRFAFLKMRRSTSRAGRSTQSKTPLFVVLSIVWLVASCTT